MATPPKFMDDAPKGEPEHDCLGYKDFSKRFAKAISEIQAENGYVIGIQGPWGSGKSTVLNFVKSYLSQDYPDEKLIVVDFAPWLISGHQDLIAGYFKVLAEAISFKKVSNESKFRQLVSFASSAADPVFKGVGALAVALNFPLALATKPIADSGGRVVGKFLENWTKEPSLQTAYKNLTKALKTDKRERRFVVFIDDIDRLEPDEIKAIFQMVKSVGGLPNVIYVLAYDRDVVLRAIDSKYDLAGKPSFADKIIQHEISLPAPSRGALSRLLSERLNFLITEPSENGRWSDIVRYGVNRWLKSVRDVVRLSNALAFAGPALAGELDPQDLFAMEGLRLFDEKAFGWIRNNRDYLVRAGNYQFLRNEEKDEMISRLHSDVKGPYKRDIIAILCTLFPARAEELAAGDRQILMSRGESNASIAARCGIATADGFDTYFSLSPTDRRVSNRDIEALMATLGDKDAASAIFTTYLRRSDQDGTSLIGLFLEQIKFRFEVPDAPSPTTELISALFGIGEAIITMHNESGDYFSSALFNFTELVNCLLRNSGPLKSNELLKSAFNSGVKAAVAAEILVTRGRELGFFSTGASSAHPLISLQDFNELGSIVMGIISKEKNEGILIDAPRYWDIMRVWKLFGDPDQARSWLRDAALSNGVNLSKIALGMLAWSHEINGRYYSLNQRPDEGDFRYKELLEITYKHQLDSDLGAEDKARLSALADGLERIILDDKNNQNGTNG